MPSRPLSAGLPRDSFVFVRVAAVRESGFILEAGEVRVIMELF